MLGSSVISPSDSMVIAGAVDPFERSISETFVTLPDTDEKIGEETAPTPSAINVPTLTRSPTLTIGFAGAPICMDVGSVTDFGAGIYTAEVFSVFFLWGTWIPFKKKDMNEPTFLWF